MAATVAMTSEAAVTSYEDFLDQEAALTQQYLGETLQLVEFLADGNPTDALIHAATARGYLEQKKALVDEAEAGSFIDERAANSRRANLDKTLLFHDKATALTEDDLKTKQQKVKEFQKAIKKQDDAERSIQQIDQKNFPRLVLKATGPSLYKSSKKVCWGIDGLPKELKELDADSCPVTVDFINPLAGNNIRPIAENPAVAPFNPCSGKICFLAGTDLGGAQVNVTYDGATVSRILFNYGTPRVHETTGEPLATLNGRGQFAGTYSGTYSGSGTIKDSCGGGPVSASGTFTSTIDADGRITVQVDLGGTGKGKMSPLGLYGTGAVGVPFMGTIVNAKFKGAILNSRLNDSAKGSGFWTAHNSCGSGSGTWEATRN